MVKHLINMTIFLSTQELAFRGNDELMNQYIQIMKVILKS
jgi:hypothetical protein